MPTGRHRLQKSVKGLNKVKLDEITEVPGLLGVKLGGQKLVEVPNREGYVYVRLRDNLSELIQAKNAKISPVYDLPVLVYRERVDKTKWVVKGRDEGRYANWGTSPYLPRHGAQHSFDPEAPGGDPVWVWGRQMMPLAAIPSGTNGGPNVLIEPYIFWRNNTWHYAGGTGTADILPSYKPTGSNARMVLVYLDSAGNPALLGGSTYFSASLTGTADIVSYIPAMPDSESLGIAGVRLLSGTSVITWNNIYDIRPWIVGNGYIPTGVSVITDHGGLSGLLDNDHPQYLLTGTAVGVTDHGALTGLTDNDHPQYLLTGTQVDHGGLNGLTDNDHPQYLLTGTQIDHGGLAGLTDNDHPQYLLTGTAITDEKVKVSSNDTTAGYLNGKLIEGAGISLTEVNNGSNETFRISYTGTSTGGGGSGNIIVYDDNIFKVTGTAFSFNDGLVVHVTGSVAYVDWTGTAGAQGEAGPPGDNTLLIYEDSIFKVTGSSISFENDFSIAVTGSIAYPSIDSVDISSDSADITAINFTEQSSNLSAPGAGHRIIFAKSDGIYSENSSGQIIGPFITGTAPISSTDEKVKVSSNDTTEGYLNGKLIEGVGISLTENNNGSNETLTIAYTGTNCGTYQRVGQPIALASITGIAWAVPGYVYASGSLGVFANGNILTPVIDYYEQFYVSGTYILNSIYATGTVFVAMWGVPCTTQIFLSTGSGALTFGIVDSNNVQIVDSNNAEIVDSNG